MYPAETQAGTQPPRAAPRSKAPVFTIGSPRSGTTLLYHMLLSAGGFAVYRTESNTFTVLGPAFGDLKSQTNRKALIRLWLDSPLYRLSGLDAKEITDKFLNSDCRNAGDFLRLVMEEIARKQGVERWAECTPEHIAWLPEIKRCLPDALIVHIIRDGRDVALSMDPLGFVRPLPWDRKHRLLVSGLFWSWLVATGRRDGRALGADYMEVHFEDLITNPRQVLARISKFIDQELDYDYMLRNPVGSLARPNSSFSSQGAPFDPVRRWAAKISPSDLEMLEACIGETLRECGYELATTAARRSKISAARMRLTYNLRYSVKQWWKRHGPLRRHLVCTRLDQLDWAPPGQGPSGWKACT